MAGKQYDVDSAGQIVKKVGWYSWRNRTRDAQDAAREKYLSLATLAPHVEVVLHGIDPMDAVAAFPGLDWSVSQSSVSPWLEGTDGDLSVTAWPKDWMNGDTNRAACLAAVDAAREMNAEVAS
jgi:hypothetical protein